MRPNMEDFEDKIDELISDAQNVTACYECGGSTFVAQKYLSQTKAELLTMIEKILTNGGANG